MEVMNTTGLQSILRKKNEAVWLLAAVVAHALLLLLPIAQPRPGIPEQSTLTVHLTPFTQTGENQAPVPLAEQMPHPVAADDTLIEQTRIIKPQADSVSSPPSAVSELLEEPMVKEPGESLPTSTQLIATVRSLSIEQPKTTPIRQLGKYSPQAHPANWQPGTGTRAVQSSHNLFAGMAVPRTTEIVDRWLAADGSHNVVINLPNGATVCGRNQAWDPMQPLVEHVMMYRSCGGGGKRTFSMSIAESRSSVASNR